MHDVVMAVAWLRCDASRVAGSSHVVRVDQVLGSLLRSSRTVRVFCRITVDREARCTEAKVISSSFLLATANGGASSSAAAGSASNRPFLVWQQRAFTMYVLLPS